MAPKPLDIQIETILDNTIATKKTYYYPGDTVEGKIFFTANNNYSLTNIRLAWTGRCSVQPVQCNKDNRIYFDECYKLEGISKSKSTSFKGSSRATLYNTHLVLAAGYNNLEQEPRVALSKNKTIGLAFQVQVPNDRPLPSCTEGSSLNKIIYLLEAFILDNQQQQQQIYHQQQKVFFGQCVVPVQEAIYTKTPEMIIPQRAEQVFVVSLMNEEKQEFTSAMRVTLPCRGCQAGVTIPVSITIWNTTEFSRRQGISISLFRVNHILANGKNYISPGEKVHRVVTDLNITSDDTNQHQKIQTVRIGLPIPKGTLPSISLEQSELLSISYYIRVQIFAQEGVYTTTEGTRSQFMMVDLPFIIGTLSTPSTTTTPISSPPRSIFSDEEASPISSPKTTLSYLPSSATSTTGLSLLISAFTSPTSNSATAVASMMSSIASISSSTLEVVNDNNSETASIRTTDTKTSTSIGGIFRKASIGSTSSSSSSSNNMETTKKKNIFSTLRLGCGKKSKNVSNNNIGSDTESIQQKENGSPTLKMTTAANKSLSPLERLTTEDNQLSATSTKMNKSRVVVTKPLTPLEKLKTTNEHQPSSIPKMNKSRDNGGVFNLFPDDDSDEEEQQATKAPTNNEGNGKGVFNLFPNNNSDKDENFLLPATTEENLPPLVASNRFQMFEDSDDDGDEEVEIHSLCISQPSTNIVLDKREKPNEKDDGEAATRFDHVLVDKPNEREYKPDTIEFTDETSSNDSDDDEGDILAMLRKREKLLSSSKEGPFVKS